VTFVAEHADALADVRANGATVTFTTTTPGTYTAATDTFGTASATTVTGVALQVALRRGDEDAFRATGAVRDRARMLLFVPTTYGQLPRPKATVTWDSTVYTVSHVNAVAPDGTAILARVGIVR
jgi:hypothetical protein